MLFVFFVSIIIVLANPRLMYTLSLDNSSLLMPEFLGETINNTSVYNSFKEDCYEGSLSEFPKHIKIRVFPSYPLYKKHKTNKKMIKHVYSLFEKINMIYTNQFNLKLIPLVVMPRITDKRPIVGSIGVVEDLNSFVSVVSKYKKKAPYNIFIDDGYTGYVGASWVRVVWASQMNIGVSIDGYSTMSHEIGHAFGAHHTLGQGGLMDYNNRLINGVLQFHQDNKQQICEFLKEHYGG